MGSSVVTIFDYLQEVIHKTAREHGWWDGYREFPECVALMHSELSEALEAYRNHESKERIGEELADTIIRILDYAEHAGISIGESVTAKMIKNEERPYRHGGKLA